MRAAVSVDVVVVQRDGVRVAHYDHLAGRAAVIQDDISRRIARQQRGGTKKS